MRTKYSLNPDEVTKALCEYLRLKCGVRDIIYDEEKTIIKLTAHITEDVEDNLISIDVWEED